MAVSNATGAIVLTTGNKSELATGYSTLYGDSAGGFAVIKDVPKTLVYELCRYRNRARARRRRRARRSPTSVLDKPPSAELRPDQRDDQSLPPYEELDPLLELYVEDDATAEELIAAGHDAALVRRVAALVDRSEYKRRQMPPGVRVSRRPSAATAACPSPTPSPRARERPARAWPHARLLAPSTPSWARPRRASAPTAPWCAPTRPPGPSGSSPWPPRPGRPPVGADPALALVVAEAARADADRVARPLRPGRRRRAAPARCSSAPGAAVEGGRGVARVARRTWSAPRSCATRAALPADGDAGAWRAGGRASAGRGARRRGADADRPGLSRLGCGPPYN